MENNSDIEDDDYRRIFQSALSNTLQLTTCRFHAHIVSEDGGSTDITDMHGGYVAERGAFKHEKTKYYEADWLLLAGGSFIRYTGEDWQLLPGSDVHAHEPSYRLPALASIPVFEDLASMSTDFTSIRTQVIDDRTFYQFGLTPI